MKKLSDMTVDELVKRNQDLGRKVDAIREQRREIVAEIASRNPAVNEAAALQARLRELGAAAEPATTEQTQ